MEKGAARCCFVFCGVLEMLLGGELWVRDTALAHCVLDPLCLCLGGLQGTFAHPTGMHGLSSSQEGRTKSN